MAEDQTTKQQTEKLSYKLEDLSKNSTSELIEYNTFIAEKAEDNRIAQAEQTFENAKETLREFNENKRINLKNQKRFKW